MNTFKCLLITNNGYSFKRESIVIPRYNNSNGVQECDGTFINEFILLYYTNVIQSFNALFCILHEFDRVNGCYSNHKNPDAKSLKVQFLEANYIKTLTYLVVVI